MTENRVESTVSEDSVQPDLTVRGVEIFKSYVSQADQQHMVQALRAAVRAAPLFSPETRFGKPMSVQMTSMGRYGWFSDRRGYRYERRHPAGSGWPPIPQPVLDVWHGITGLARLPDCCLLNFYRGPARMGLHQDRDEADFSFPVLSISLGDDALFRIGSTTRGGKTESLWLRSGDVVVMGGPARLCFHGVDKIRPGSSQLLPDGGRINLTLRVVD